MNSFSYLVGFVYSDRFLEHMPPAGHPERPDRLAKLVQHLKESRLWDELIQILPVVAREEQILAVHSGDHMKYVRDVCAAGGGVLDEGDTHASPGSFEVALLAAGAVNAAIDAVVAKKVGSAFCAVRPPGHHAEQNRPMGFCLFNNVAVGARYAQQKHGMKRVAIIDWDVHHGNGTQHIFEDDPTVFYCSLHQYPFYPGTGSRDERGKAKGEGYTLNIPLPAGTGEARYLVALSEEVMPALETFKPDLLLLSAGFDAHKDDPLASMQLTENSYAEMTHLVKDLAPVVSVLEGGYNLAALARSVERHLRALGRR